MAILVSPIPSHQKHRRNPKVSQKLSANATPGGDLFASPGDPYFFLHHAQIDRTWWIWQNQDLKTRQNAMTGATSLFNPPGSPNATLDDLLDLGVLAPKIPMRDAMSTLSDQFCYTYE